MSPKIEIPNLDDLLRRYVAGESENKLAREAGINRWTFRRRLLAAGIKPRTQSEAERLKWASMSPEQRAHQVKAAHDAVRGSKRSPESLHRQALGNQRTLSHAAPIEQTFADWLHDRGLTVTPQKAIGPYNVDLAIELPPVAVEINGGGWHFHGRHKGRFHERTKYILNAGWSVVIIWADMRRYPLSGAAADYIVALVKTLRRNPPARGQYRVILGDGQDAPTVKSQFNAPADIERLSGG